MWLNIVDCLFDISQHVARCSHHVVMNRELMTPFEQAELKTDLEVNSKVMRSFERRRHTWHDTIKMDGMQSENNGVKQTYC